MASLNVKALLHGWLGSGYGVVWDPQSLESMSCCEVMVGGVFRFNQIDNEYAFSQIGVGFVSRTDLRLRSRTRWWLESIKGLRQRQRLKPYSDARGETEMMMRLLF